MKHQADQLIVTPVAGQEGATLLLQGRLSYLRSRALVSPFDVLLQDARHPEIRIDCSGVTHVDSSGVGMLKVLQERGRRHHKRVTITNPSHVMRLCRLFELH